MKSIGKICYNFGSLFGGRNMSTSILPALTRAAGVGAIIGIGAEITDSRSKGWMLVASIVTAVALRALTYYFGVGAAIGVVIGACAGIGSGRPGAPAGYRELIGGALIGGTLGYLAEQALPGDMKVIVIPG